MTIDDFEQQVMAERDAEIEKKLQDEENQRVHFTMQEISNLEKVCNFCRIIRERKPMKGLEIGPLLLGFCHSGFLTFQA